MRIVLSAVAAPFLLSCAEPTAIEIADERVGEVPTLDFNGAVLVEQRGSVLYSDAKGVADFQSGQNFEIETPSRVASLTKQFTAAATFKLVEAGQIDLSDPVSDYLEGLPNDIGRITIAQLLNHSSGLSRPSQDSASERPGMTTRERMGPFLALPLDFEPGSRHEYSNSGYIVLGAIIEKVSGRSYPDAIDEMLLKPLELQNTRALFDHEPHARLADDVRRSGGKLVQDDYRVSDRGAPFSAGMIVSTVGDLVAWTRALHEGRVFDDPDTLELMLATPGGWESNRAFDQWAYASGLFRARRDNGREFIFHDGRLGSYLADLRYYPEQDLVIAVIETAGGDVTATADALEDWAFDQMTD